MLAMEKAGDGGMEIGVCMQRTTQPSAKLVWRARRCVKLTRWTDDMGMTDRAGKIYGRWISRSITEARTYGAASGTARAVVCTVVSARVFAEDWSRWAEHRSIV